MLVEFMLFFTKPELVHVSCYFEAVIFDDFWWFFSPWEAHAGRSTLAEMEGSARGSSCYQKFGNRTTNIDPVQGSQNLQ